MYNWEYLTFKNCKLYTEYNELYCYEEFSTEKEAEEYLQKNDLRATIR